MGIGDWGLGIFGGRYQSFDGAGADGIDEVDEELQEEDYK